MNNKISLLIILFVLGSLTGVASQPDDDPVFSNQAEGLGRGGVSGQLQVALFEYEEIGESVAPAGFSLSVERLQIETDRSEIATDGFRPLVESESHQYFEAYIEGLENRQNHRLSVWPYHDNVSVKANDQTCSSLEPSKQESIDRLPIIDAAERERNRTSVSETLRWQNCNDSASITISGDFLVRLWEWDAELTAQGDHETLRSGQQNHQDLPEGSPDLSLVAGEAQEQFLYARNATLTIAHLDSYHEIYLNDASLNATNGYRLSETTGSILGIPLQGEEVTVNGDGLLLHTTSTGPNESLSAFLDGPIEHIKIDDETVATNTLTTDDPRRIPLIAFLAMVAVALLIVIGTATTTVWHTNTRLRNGIESQWVDYRDHLFDQALKEVHEYSADQPRKARKWARIALFLQPSHPEAIAALARAYFSQRKYRKALKRYQDAIDSIDGDYASPQVPRDAAAFWSVDAARCLARLRIRVTDMHERDQLTDQILFYSRLACNIDPTVGRVLLHEDTLQDLEEQIRLALDYQDYARP